MEVLLRVGKFCHKRWTFWRYNDWFLEVQHLELLFLFGGFAVLLLKVRVGICPWYPHTFHICSCDYCDMSARHLDVHWRESREARLRSTFITCLTRRVTSNVLYWQRYLYVLKRIMSLHYFSFSIQGTTIVVSLVVSNKMESEAHFKGEYILDLNHLS